MPESRSMISFGTMWGSFWRLQDSGMTSSPQAGTGERQDLLARKKRKSLNLLSPQAFGILSSLQEKKTNSIVIQSQHNY